MSIDSLKALLEGFDPASFLPKLDTLAGKLETMMRIAGMVGPVVLQILGLAYLLLSPKEANHSFGYRCYFGMGSVEAWRFSQRLAGLVWGALGLVLSIVMLIIVNKYRGMDMNDMVWSAVKCILWELGLILFSWLAINTTVAIFFDAKGNRRLDKKKTK